MAGKDVSGRLSPQRPTRRDVVLGGMLAATAGVAFARAPRNKLASIAPDQLEHTVPLQIGPWHYQQSSGIVLPPPDELARILYDQQIARAYATEDSAVMLAVAYGSSQGGLLQVHRPEICYPASGFRLSDTQTIALKLDNGKALPCRFFTARSDTRTEQVLYWTRVGNDLPTSWASQRWAIMLSNLRGEIPDGLLVRMSIVTQDEAHGRALLDRFARAMLAAAGPRGRQRLVGDVYA